MVHELWVEAEIFAKSEAIGVVFIVFAKFLALWKEWFDLGSTVGVGCFTNRINILSTHLRTSGLSSVSARYTAMRAIRTAAASWSKPALM